MKAKQLIMGLLLSFFVVPATYSAQKVDDLSSDYNDLMRKLFLKDQEKSGHTLSGERLKGETVRVGIVGGGMAGLYSALLIKQMNEAKGLNVEVKIFEANDRVGGRVYTHRFSDDLNQYFEAGAMRIPSTHTEVFGLIDFVNNKLREKFPNDEKKRQRYEIKKIAYQLHDEGKNNYVYANGKRPQLLNAVVYEDFEFKDEDGTVFKESPDALLSDAIKQPQEEIIDILTHKDLERFKDFLKRYDDFSMRNYLLFEKKWTHEKINYVEVMTAQTHQFNHSFVELLIENLDFSSKEWVTIDQGMSRLPQACSKIIGRDNILLNAKVFKVEQSEEKVKVYHSRSDYPEEFDRVILALPPSVVRMIDRGAWVEKEEAIRSMYFEPLYKIGLRFKERFWEKVASPSLGGQSITDLPSRWIVYPSNGLRAEGYGVLLCYSWTSDALKWLPFTAKEQEDGAIRDLSILYPGSKVRELFVESHSVSWCQEWPLGDAKFLPGQLKKYLAKAGAPENNIFFAGEHLSVYHTWIRGAVDSARTTVGQMFGTTIEALK